MASSIVELSNLLDKLSLSYEEEIILLSTILVDIILQKSPNDAKILSAFIVDILKSKNTFLFRNTPKTDLSKTNLSREKWGLDPSLIDQEN